MKHKLTLSCCALMTAAFSPATTNAQFLAFLPAESNYFRSEVKAELSGLTFTYWFSAPAPKTLIVRTDNNGQVQWTKQQTGTRLSSYTLAPDTSVILTGRVKDNIGDWSGLLQKLDKNGNTVWAKSLKIASKDVSIDNIMVAADNTIYATLTQTSFMNSTDYSRAAVAAYDGNGNMLWTKHFGNSALTAEYSFSRTLLAANGDFIGVADVSGSVGAPASGMMITRISPQGTVRFSKYIDFKTTHLNLSVTGLAETASGKLVIGGRLMTGSTTTRPNTMWMARLDSAGSMELQKVYSGGVNVGEQLFSLRYNNGKLYAYMHLYYAKKSLWVGTVNEQTLAFTAQNSEELQVHNDDAYGNVRNSFCITSDGKPTVAAGFYCDATGTYYPLLQQWSSSLASSCTALDTVQPLVDSVVNYAVAPYTPQSSFTVTYAADTTTLFLDDIAPVVKAGLCSGCATPTGISQVAQKEGLRMYPNPGDGRYFIDLENFSGEAQVAIFNIMGAAVYQSTLSGTHQLINLTEQPAGLYLVRVRTRDGRVMTSRLVKDR